MQRRWKEEVELQMAAADIVVVAVEEGGRWTLVEAALLVVVVVVVAVVVLDMRLVKDVGVYTLEDCQVVAVVVVVEDLQVWLVVESLKRGEPWLSAQEDGQSHSVVEAGQDVLLAVASDILVSADSLLREIVREMCEK